MLIQTSQIRDWRDLQDKVAMLFREMGYEINTPFTVELAGRGRKEVDVYIVDPRASINQIILVECKFWNSLVPQEAVHSFHTVMNGAGANTGFIISKRGFQSGAYEAAKSTNIHLLTWDELQHKFGRQWYLYQSESRDKILSKLRIIGNLYLDQFNPSTIHNTMFFRATGLEAELLDVLADLHVALMAAAVTGPSAYDVPGPIEVSVYKGFPGATTDQLGLSTLVLADVRAFFKWLMRYGTEQLERFDALQIRAHRSFDGLSDRGAAFAETMKLLVEESPIRTFKDVLGDELYNQLIRSRLSGSDQQC